MEFNGQMSNHFPTSSLLVFYWTLPRSLDPTEMLTLGSHWIIQIWFWWWWCLSFLGTDTHWVMTYHGNRNTICFQACFVACGEMWPDMWPWPTATGWWGSTGLARLLVTSVYTTILLLDLRQGRPVVNFLYIGQQGKGEGNLPGCEYFGGNLLRSKICHLCLQSFCE